MYGTSFPSITFGAGSCVDLFLPDIVIADEPMLFLDMPLEMGNAINAALLLVMVDASLE